MTLMFFSGCLSGRAVVGATTLPSWATGRGTEAKGVTVKAWKNLDSGSNSAAIGVSVGIGARSSNTMGVTVGVRKSENRNLVDMLRGSGSLEGSAGSPVGLT